MPARDAELVTPGGRTCGIAGGSFRVVAWGPLAERTGPFEGASIVERSDVKSCVWWICRFWAARFAFGAILPLAGTNCFSGVTIGWALGDLASKACCCARVVGGVAALPAWRSAKSCR